MEVSISNEVNESMQGNISSGSTQSSQPKKAKLSDDLAVDDNVLGMSPVLQHKLPSSRLVKDQESEEDTDDRGVETNMCGVKYVMWFDVGIEGKDPMDQEEEDWGGRVEFGFSDKHFPKDIED